MAKIVERGRIERGVRISYSILECSCGRRLELAAFTNTCECGRDYNFAGQELAPRSQWGEETGEHWTECY